jgi:hypothetical protein
MDRYNGVWLEPAVHMVRAPALPAMEGLEIQRELEITGACKRLCLPMAVLLAA